MVRLGCFFNLLTYVGWAKRTHMLIGGLVTVCEEYLTYRLLYSPRQVVFITLQAAFALAIFLLVQSGAKPGFGPNSETSTSTEWDNLSAAFLGLVCPDSPHHTIFTDNPQRPATPARVPTLQPVPPPPPPPTPAHPPPTPPASAFSVHNSKGVLQTSLGDYAAAQRIIITLSEYGISCLTYNTRFWKCIIIYFMIKSFQSYKIRWHF